MLQRFRQQVVVHIRQNAEGIASSAQAREGRIGIRERHPVGQAFGKEGGARSVDCPAEASADPHRSVGEYVAIAPVLRRLGRRPRVEQGSQHCGRVEADSICGRGVLECLGDTSLPVDERPVAVEGDDVERAHT